MKTGELVKSKLPQHNKLTTWRIEEIIIGLSGRKRFLCVASHDTKMNTGFDAIHYDFKESEIELI
jgi:hypothetical protein